MDNKDGMSPRKAMASGPGGSFGVSDYPGSKGTVTHIAPVLGAQGAMGDGERGIKPGVGSKPMRQAAPDHGPMPDHFDRGERKAW